MRHSDETASRRRTRGKGALAQANPDDARSDDAGRQLSCGIVMDWSERLLSSSICLFILTFRIFHSFQTTSLHCTIWWCRPGSIVCKVGRAASREGSRMHHPSAFDVRGER